jgi:anti-sigma regulatory factor (Ser/Thr protein kinase)
MSHEDEPLSPDPAAAVLADHCHLRIPSQPDWITPTVDYLVQRAVRSGAIPASRETKLTIALHEALTNAVIHGNLGISSELKERGDDEFLRAVQARLADPAHATRVVDVRASYDGRAARWVLHDQGSGFDAPEALRKLEDPDPFLPSGRGMLLIKAFTDEMQYEDGGRRLVLTVRKQERRQELRWPMSEAVTVTPLDEEGRPAGEGRTVVGRNVSPDGLAFLTSGEPPSGRVLLCIPGGERPVEVMAEVRRWQALEGNVIEVGCRFEVPLEWPPPEAACDDLGRLVERLSGGRFRSEERRRSPRVPYGGRVEVLLPTGEVRIGYGRDLSRGGVAFLCSGEVPLEAVRLRLAVGEHEAITVRAVVLRVTKLIEGFFDVAVRFVPE